MGLAVLAAPIIQLLFQRGAFTAADTRLMVPITAVFAMGLPFFSFVNLVLRAFYAQKDTATPVRAAFLSFAVNLGLSITLMGPLSTVGLAIASNVAIIVQAWYLQVHLARKQPAMAFHHLTRDAAKVLLASLLMGAVVAAGWWCRRLAPTGVSIDALVMTMLIGAGALLYTGLIWVFNVQGREDVIAVLRRRRNVRPKP
jgi:putative peptidoglycan lipid II flippase